MSGIFKALKRLEIAVFSGVSLMIGGCLALPNPIVMPNGDYLDAARAVPYAAKAPLRDFNIGIAPMPHQLATLQNPYGTDTHESCAILLREAQDLHTALTENTEVLSGPQYNMNTRAGYVAKATEEAVSTAATTFIPFRGPIRTLSGAKRRSKLSQRADQRGRERLGFLIGVGSANGCPGFYVPRRYVY